MWPALIANLAVVGFFVSVWANMAEWALGHSKRTERLAFGVIMGLAAGFALQFTFEVSPGVFFDLRGTPVAIAGFLGGPIAGLIAAALAAASRVALGGAGMMTGVVGVTLSLSVGLGAYWLLRQQRMNSANVAAFALAGAVLPLLSILTLPGEALDRVLSGVLLPVAILAFLANFAAGFAIVRARALAQERALLRGAIEQAPEYFYVKDSDSRFVAANRRVAEINGAASPAALSGKTDFDLTSPQRAASLLNEEQWILATGRALDGREELVPDAMGNGRNFITSKSPVRTGDGTIIGLVGVTRDVTEERLAEVQLRESRNRLGFVLGEMSDGVALVSRDGHIILSNARFQELFPLTGKVRVAGAFMPAVLQAVIDTGEQPDAAKRGAAWISEVMTFLRTGGEELTQLYDGRWLNIRCRVHQNGLSILVASDVTDMKRTETDLRVMTKQLEVLAVTDGLTGILNRRGFDDSFERELLRAKRTDQPLSVVLIDIDRFKAYNDRYGHLEGDRCLHDVAVALRQATNRPGDIVARYGGEEFAIILPDTHAQGAYFVAEQVRQAIRALARPHEASEKGVVTVSAGLATIDPQDPAASSKLLLSRADEALYLAKGGGRDCTVAWRAPDQPYANVAHV